MKTNEELQKDVQTFLYYFHPKIKIRTIHQRIVMKLIFNGIPKETQH